MEQLLKAKQKLQTNEKTDKILDQSFDSELCQTRQKRTAI